MQGIPLKMLAEKFLEENRKKRKRRLRRKRRKKGTIEAEMFMKMTWMRMCSGK